MHSHPAAAPARTPVVGTTRDATPARPPSWLVLATNGPGCDLERLVPGDVMIVPSGAAFMKLLSEAHPRIAVLSDPPAQAAELVATAAARHRRASLQVMLVNRPDDAAGRIRALQLGFDEALPATVDPEELCGRGLILLERGRARARANRQLLIGPEVALDPVSHRVRRGGAEIHVRPKEYSILALLAAHPGRVFTRRELIDRVWGAGYGGDPRTIDVHVRWLRAKIEDDPSHPAHLVTVRGAGYRLDPPGA